MQLKFKKIKLIVLITLFIPIFSSIAAKDSYFSQLSNQSNKPNLIPYKLIKTRIWPESGCVIDSGPQIINPGDNANLRINKQKNCAEAGVGYSLYKLSDIHNKNLLGYVSHRFRDGRFSLQVSIFCEGEQCVFKDLNPEQSINNK
jgi:hypothetical protein